jgi:hypothetical protein
MAKLSLLCVHAERIVVESGQCTSSGVRTQVWCMLRFSHGRDLAEQLHGGFCVSQEDQSPYKYKGWRPIEWHPNIQSSFYILCLLLPYSFLTPCCCSSLNPMTKDGALGLSANLGQPGDVLAPTGSLLGESFDSFFACKLAGSSSCKHVGYPLVIYL